MQLMPSYLPNLLLMNNLRHPYENKRIIGTLLLTIIKLIPRESNQQTRLFYSLLQLLSRLINNLLKEKESFDVLNNYCCIYDFILAQIIRDDEELFRVSYDL